MIKSTYHSPTDHSIPQRARRSLELLRDAFEYARQSNCDLWEFAIELEQIKQPGISISDLRWLARMDLVQHAVEVTAYNDGQRRFEKSENLAFYRQNLLCHDRKGHGGAATARQ